MTTKKEVHNLLCLKVVIYYNAGIIPLDMTEKSTGFTKLALYRRVIVNRKKNKIGLII